MPPTVSIIIPMYRDEVTISKTLEALADFFYTHRWDAELIVVNDGGSDRGVAIVEDKMRLHPFIRLINRAVNRGKGFSVREGIASATGQYIFFTDADLPYGTEPLIPMLERLQTQEVDVIIANRDLAPSLEKTKAIRQLTHFVYSHFVRLFIPIHFSDTLAGLKAFTGNVAKKIIPKLTIDRFSFDVELLLAAKRSGFRSEEMPVSLKNIGTSNLHIRRDAPKMVSEIFQIWMQDRKGRYQ